MILEKVELFLGTFSGCSAARLAHLVWDQRVAGSNPATPTKEKALSQKRQGFVFHER